jgi:hypothetical protein
MANIENTIKLEELNNNITTIQLRKNTHELLIICKVLNGIRTFDETVLLLLNNFEESKNVIR